MAPSSTLVSKIKVHLKLAISRLRIVQQKDQAIAKQQRRAMAQLLEQGKIESARIRVENIIRSDLITELHEILELYCELLLARSGLMDPQQCDPGLEEAVKSIIYAAPRTDIKELQQTRVLLVEKYGKEFGQAAMENVGDRVPERVLKKLRVEPPSHELVESYLKAIAAAYNVSYGQDSDAQNDGGDDADDDEPGSGGQKEPILEDPLPAQELRHMSPPRDLGPRSPVSIAPPSPSTDNANPQVKLPGAPDLKPSAKMARKQPGKSEPVNGKPGPEGKIPDVDDLESRFANLKK